ncbi:MAG: N-acetylneuraminate synthase family protein [Parcubacteria group bacterium]|nr:N-acetylneuraminate synthase family protein [Parcubacteria group bacterium]
MQRIKNLKEYGFDTDKKTYIIGEIGINHGGSLEKAKALIDSAAKTGVDAVKFQTYLTEQRAPKDNQQVYDILKKCELAFEAFKELKSYTEQYNIDFFSTPFDKESVECLENIDCGIYKISSFDVVNHSLLREVSKTGKTVIMSVGMANIDEVKEAYSILKKGTSKIALLHCVSAYPLKEEDTNLAAIYRLREKFLDCIIGYSGHTNDITMPLYAVAAGAQIIEKHFKIDDSMDCIDSAVSITEIQMRKLVNEIRKLERCFGDGGLGIRAAEEGTKVFRRPTE